MKTIKTKLEGVVIIDIEKTKDNRGCKETIIDTDFLIANNINFVCKLQRIYDISKKGTLFGIHFQELKYPQAKMIYCLKGKGLDYIVDLKRSSPTYKQWIAINVSEEDDHHIYIPQGYGHAFLALDDNTKLLFSVDEMFHKEYSRTIRYDDPELNIQYPIEIDVLSEKDKNALFLVDLE